MKGIYSILNTVDQKRYIGKSSNIEKRFIMHRCLLNNNKHWNKHFQRAWQKHGEENFSFEVIIETNKNLNRKECYYIKKYNTRNDNFGYNKTSGGDGLHNPSKEVREKISKTLKQRYASGEKKIHYGKNFFDFWVEKYGIKRALIMKEKAYKKSGESQKRRYTDPQERMKTSNAAKKQWQDPKMRQKMVEAAKRRWAKARGEI